MIRINGSQTVNIWDTQTDINSLSNITTDINTNTSVNQHSMLDERKVDYNKASDKNLEKAVDGLNKTMEIIERGLEFSIHEGTNRIMVKVVDRANDEKVIREIPPEKLLDLIAEINDVIGLLIDCQV